MGRGETSQLGGPGCELRLRREEERSKKCQDNYVIFAKIQNVKLKYKSEKP